MDNLICKSCLEPVESSSEDYYLFEGMHWICFHFTFEHNTDRDKPCSDPSCPWNRINDLKEKLSSASKLNSGVNISVADVMWVVQNKFGITYGHSDEKGLCLSFKN